MGLNINYLTSLFGGSPVVPGTAGASQPLVLDGSKNVASLGALSGTSWTGLSIGLHTGTLRFTVGPDVAATGSVIGDAAALIEGFQVVTGADGTKGVILPVAVAGAVVIIKGTTAAVLKVWPQTGAQINAVGASTAMSLASGVIPAIFIAKSATQWYTLPLLPS
jgi:hypothetical protein